MNGQVLKTIGIIIVALLFFRYCVHITPIEQAPDCKPT
jgi:hypothetical protein